MMGVRSQVDQERRVRRRATGAFTRNPTWYAVSICVHARSAPIVAHKPPPHTPRLMAALDEINPEGRVCIGLARPIPYAMHVVRIIGLSKSIKKSGQINRLRRDGRVQVRLR